VAALGISLTACAGNADKFGSIKQDAAVSFEAPTYAVKGKTQYDQDWIDGQIEGGVAGLGWERPKPRPPELDMPAKPAAKPAPAKPAAPKKATFRQRFGF
jgi:hypothetical protein